jgi:DNA uptake protein ComE-like DNA-binding protein
VRQRGVALLAVLVLITLLSLLATSALSLSISHRRGAQRLAQVAQAELLADSAIRMTLFELMNPRTAQTPNHIGQHFAVEVLNAVVDVSLEMESGRIDLNAATEDLLFAAFAANGWHEDDARSMATRIAVWRNSNGLFESIESLRRVAGGEKISDELLNSFTVYAHSLTPSPRVATESAKRALSLADKRQLGGKRWLLAPAENSSEELISNDVSVIGEVIRMHSCPRNQETPLCRLAIARLTGKAAAPLQVFLWRSVG